MLNRNLISLICCGIMLNLSVISVTQAQDSPLPGDNMKPFSQTDPTGFKEGRFRGEVVRIDGQHYIIKTKHGEEKRLLIDEHTKKTGSLKQGDRVEVQLDSKNHVLSIKPYSQEPMNKKKQE